MKSTTYHRWNNQKNEKYMCEGRNPLVCLPPCLVALCKARNFQHEFTEKCFAIFDESSCAISYGIGRSYFSGNFLSFLLWYDFKIRVKSWGGGTFLSLALSVNVWQKYFFSNWKLNIWSFIFLIWTEQFWIWFRWKLTKTVEISLFFKVFVILPPVWLSNLGSDLSMDNIVWLGSADTKSGSQNAVKKMLEHTEKWKYPNFIGKF